MQLQEYDTYSECVEALNAKVRRRPDHRQHDPRRLRRQPAYKGKLKVVGKTFSEENYGIGLKKGDTALCTKVTDALKKMIADGSWQKAVDDQPRPGRLQARRRQPAHARAACS